jgi:hypothetical protein
MNLDKVLENIYKLSFDPYQCAELRWGMTDVESLKSCRFSKDKMDWYQAEHGLKQLIKKIKLSKWI